MFQENGEKIQNKQAPKKKKKKKGRNESLYISHSGVHMHTLADTSAGVKIRAGWWRYLARFLFCPLEIFPKFTKTSGSLRQNILTNYSVIS